MSYPSTALNDIMDLLQERDCSWNEITDALDMYGVQHLSQALDSLKRQGLVEEGDTSQSSGLFRAVDIGFRRSAPAGSKHDQDKPRTALMIDGFSQALNEVAKVTTFGAKKYAPDNWRLVEDGAQRYRDAAFRHLLESARYRNDDESGLPHLAHAVWCLLAVMELQILDGVK